MRGFYAVSRCAERCRDRRPTVPNSVNVRAIGPKSTGVRSGYSASTSRRFDMMGAAGAFAGRVVPPCYPSVETNIVTI